MLDDLAKLPASFRDPSGFVFSSKGKIFRQVNEYYKSDFEFAESSGLFDELIKDGLLIKHTEVKLDKQTKGVFKLLESEKVDFVSYPYEWSFSQYKDAALLTLEIQRRALKKGLTLKDATAYNVQFHKGKPIFIDTLSFEKYKDGEPWVAYKQFCQHFLAPLSLMAKTDIDLSKLMRIYIDGIPLHIASKLLPAFTKLNLGLGVNIHMHSKSQKKHASDGENAQRRRVSKSAIEGIVMNLAKTIKKLRWESKATEWGEYYSFTNYSDQAFKQKKQIIEGYLKKARPKSVWDVGANNGLFSRIASNKEVSTIAFDIDPIAVERNYKEVKKNKEKFILPLVMDLTNPSPSLGWDSQERDSMTNRGPADMVFSLALIHHLAISNNTPLEKISEYMSHISDYLVMEFVPKGDSQVNILLATRKDIFPEYHEEGFEKAFSKNFKIISRDKVEGSKRTLYLLKKTLA